MTLEVVVEVDGQPKPKGSLRHVGGGRLIEQVNGSAAFRRAVADAVALTVDHTIADRPVVVTVVFSLPRPKAATRRLRPHTRSSGDLDKLARNVLDALVDAGAICDDSQVVELSASKVYCGSADWGAREKPGARIWVSEA